MKSASALGRRHVRLSAFVVSAVVAGLILSVSAVARTQPELEGTSRSEPDLERHARLEGEPHPAEGRRP